MDLSLDTTWMDDELTHGLTHGWLFDAVLLAYLIVYQKNSAKFPAFCFFPEKLQANKAT